MGRLLGSRLFRQMTRYALIQNGKYALRCRPSISRRRARVELIDRQVRPHHVIPRGGNWPDSLALHFADVIRRQ